jgi:beta-lactamase class A
MRVFALLLTLTAPLAAQTPLHQQIAEIAKDAKGTVYVACSLPGTKLDCDLSEHGHPPMQSTFKFPLAMAVLHQIELGKLQLDQPIRFLKSVVLLIIWHNLVQIIWHTIVPDVPSLIPRSV